MSGMCRLLGDIPRVSEMNISNVRYLEDGTQGQLNGYIRMSDGRPAPYRLRSIGDEYCNPI